MMMYGFDPVHLMFAIPGLLLGIYAQIKLSSAYKRYMRVGIGSGQSGAEAARQILARNGLTDVAVLEVPGHLTDHYDPTKRTLSLSSENFHSQSIAAVGVAAHEAGHALQHQASYAMLNLRMQLVPVTNFASTSYWLIFLAGIILARMHVIGGPMFANFIWVAIGLFTVVTVFQIITLPVEFDASRRAKEQLFRLGMVREDERDAIGKVLGAAALTYVAAMVSSVMELLYLLSATRNRN
jgi:Zn-dependent membrane protease YugP